MIVESLNPVQGVVKIPSDPNFNIAFSWGNVKNMSYKFGPVEDVAKNVDDFLQTAGFSTQEHLVNLAPVHGNRLEIVEKDDLSGFSELSLDQRIIEADGFFASDPEIVLTVKPADCATIIFTFYSSSPPDTCPPPARRRGGKRRKGALVSLDKLSKPLPASPSQGRKYQPWIGMVHIGIIDYLNDFLGATKNFLERQFDDIQNLNIYISPFIKRYRVNKDSALYERLENVSEIKDDKRFIDMHSEVYKQVNHHWKEAEIRLYNADTWQAASEGKSFSHSYSFYHPQAKEGRFIVCAQIAQGRATLS